MASFEQINQASLQSADAPTIAAIATAPGRGGVGVVRVSGPDAWQVAARVTGKDSSTIAEYQGRFFHSHFFDAGRRMIDDGLVLVFKAPASYTGEDVVELQCHGGSRPPELVLAACLNAGARLARKGEFTLRAFLNAKLSLSEAEAVIDLIDARTDAAASDATRRLGGATRRLYDTFYSEALEISADIEHSLDFDDGELPSDFLANLRNRMANLECRIIRQAESAREGRLLHFGAKVVIYGAPNTGKSSLLNALAGEKRAIVDSSAGTTRDAIEVLVELGGFPVRLIDTAGVRSAADNHVEVEGIRIAKALAGDADVVIETFPADEHFQGCGVSANSNTIPVFTKCDLAKPPAIPGFIYTSAAACSGIGDLKTAIIERLRQLSSASADSSMPDATVREANLLNRAGEYLRSAISELVSPAPELSLVANMLADTTSFIGEIIGKSYKSDLLDAIFSRFCIGK